MLMFYLDGNHKIYIGGAQAKLYDTIWLKFNVR